MASSLVWQCHHFKDFSLEALYQALRLRDQVFVLEQQSIYGDIDNLDQTALHISGYDAAGVLQAYARLLPPASKYSDAVAIGRVVVSPPLRGQGIGHALMTEALQQCTRFFPGVKLKLSAQVKAASLYQTFGFVPVGEVYDDGGIDHLDMWRAPDPL